ncbi:hypothetical protein CYLTODRAFT_460041 [Cylindrobasidium torrendii FP15055 ss-10]|uniref:C2H2-type domain-containing protein n=1 Tax=Cylindrobasidium torrendii FP15055 ss-10 TaxID=1314674 RepID=A0A0D7ASA2_9AGAR|nr:hypothetical protein CYLTODRAFT_460041 [Cylindrobasidium torrendii FP15055 ss-10]
MQKLSNPALLYHNLPKTLDRYVIKHHTWSLSTSTDRAEAGAGGRDCIQCDIDGGGAFDDVAERMLKVNPNNAEAKYAHFSLENILSTNFLDYIVAALVQKCPALLHCDDERRKALEIVAQKFSDWKRYYMTASGPALAQHTSKSSKASNPASAAVRQSLTPQSTSLPQTFPLALLYLSWDPSPSPFDYRSRSLSPKNAMFSMPSSRHLPRITIPNSLPEKPCFFPGAKPCSASNDELIFSYIFKPFANRYDDLFKHGSEYSCLEDNNSDVCARHTSAAPAALSPLALTASSTIAPIPSSPMLTPSLLLAPASSLPTPASSSFSSKPTPSSPTPLVLSLGKRKPVDIQDLPEKKRKTDSVLELPTLGRFTSLNEYVIGLSAKGLIAKSAFKAAGDALTMKEKTAKEKAAKARGQRRWRWKRSELRLPDSLKKCHNVQNITEFCQYEVLATFDEPEDAPPAPPQDLTPDPDTPCPDDINPLVRGTANEEPSSSFPRQLPPLQFQVLNSNQQLGFLRTDDSFDMDVSQSFGSGVDVTPQLPLDTEGFNSAVRGTANEEPSSSFPRQPPPLQFQVLNSNQQLGFLRTDDSFDMDVSQSFGSGVDVTPQLPLDTEGFNSADDINPLGWGTANEEPSISSPFFPRMDDSFDMDIFQSSNNGVDITTRPEPPLDAEGSDSEANDVLSPQGAQPVERRKLRARPEQGVVYERPDVVSDMDEDGGSNNDGSDDKSQMDGEGEPEAEMSGADGSDSEAGSGEVMNTASLLQECGQLLVQIGLEYDGGLAGFFCTRSPDFKHPGEPCGNFFFTYKSALEHIQLHHHHLLEPLQRRQLRPIFPKKSPQFQRPARRIPPYKYLPIEEGTKCPKCTFASAEDAAVIKHLSQHHDGRKPTNKTVLESVYFQTIHRTSFCVSSVHNPHSNSEETRIARELQAMSKAKDSNRKLFRGQPLDSNQLLAKTFLWEDYTADKDPELLREQCRSHLLRSQEEESQIELDGSSEDEDDDYAAGLAVQGRLNVRGLRLGVTAYLKSGMNILGNSPEEALSALTSGGDSSPAVDFQEQSTIAKYAGGVFQYICYLYWRPSDGRWSESYLRPPLNADIVSSLQAVAEALHSEDEAQLFAELDKLFNFLWFNCNWPQSTSALLDPTLCWLALKHLKDDGTFAVDRVANNTHYLLFFMKASFVRRCSQGDLIPNIKANFHWIDPNGTIGHSKRSTYSVVHRMRSLAGQTFRSQLASPTVNTDSLASQGFLVYKDTRIFNMEAFKKMIGALEQEIIATWTGLLQGLCVEVDFASTPGICDTLTSTANRYSFINDPRNRHLLVPSCQLLKHLTSLAGWMNEDLPVEKMWEEHFLKPLAGLEQNLALHAQYGSGSPWRGTELVTLLFQNTSARSRNFCYMEPYLVATSEYSKTSSVMGRDRFVPKAVPSFTSRMLLQVHAIARPIVVWYLRACQSTVRVSNEPLANLYHTMAFMNNGQPFTAGEISSSMKQWAQAYLNWPMDLSSYRHIQTALHRELCTQSPAHNQSAFRAAQKAALGRVNGNHLFARSDDEELGGLEQVFLAYFEVSGSWQEVLGLQKSGGSGMQRTWTDQIEGYDSQLNHFPHQLRCWRLMEGGKPDSDIK